ncbi:hypothetical protein ACU5AY_09005 [Rhizobium sp. PAMB 3174]
MSAFHRPMVLSLPFVLCLIGLFIGILTRPTVPLLGAIPLDVLFSGVEGDQPLARELWGHLLFTAGIGFILGGIAMFVVGKARNIALSR